MFNRGPAIPTVEVEQLPADGYLLDVREVDEWECGHAPHAVHLPMSELMARVDEQRSEESRVGKECRSRWSPYH